MATFRDLYHKLRVVLQESWVTGEVAAHFGPTATLDDMFRYMWLRPEAQQVLQPPAGDCRISRKGAAEAEKFRNEGNRLYRERKLEAALLAYNYSLLAAPHPGLDAPPSPAHLTLALAFGNRSAVLYEMGQYELALADAERALALQYPPAKSVRLQERRAKCLHGLGRQQEAKRVLEEILSALAGLNLEQKEAAAARASAKALLAKCDVTGLQLPSPPPQQYQRVFHTGPAAPPPLASPRPDVPCLSDAVTIQYSPIRGRHLVATVDIQPGTVLAVEAAVAATVRHDATLRTHCCHCLRRAPVPLPCPSCSLVVYCSEACQGAAGGHGAECGALAALVGLGLDPAPALAFRVLAAAHLAELRASVSAVAGEGRGPRPLVVSRDYRALYHLEGHATARTEAQLQETAALACVLTRLLFEQCPSFTGGAGGPVGEADVVLVGGQLMRLILGLECNVHATKEVEVGPAGVEGGRGREVGWAVYSALSLVNHSCVPNSLTASLGATKFLYSISVIPRGAEITDTYGERFVSHRRDTRRAALSRHYFFCCGCAACQGDWPLFPDLAKKPSLRCPSCCQVLVGFTCHLCQLACTRDEVVKGGVRLYDAPSVSMRLSKMWPQYEAVAARVRAGQVPAGAMQVVVSMLSLLDRYTVHPNQAYVSVQETLMTCLDLHGAVHYLPLP